MVSGIENSNFGVYQWSNNPEEIPQGDQEIAIAAIEQDGHAIDALRNDREIVMAAVQQYGYANTAPPGHP